MGIVPINEYMTTVGEMNPEETVADNDRPQVPVATTVGAEKEADTTE